MAVRYDQKKKDEVVAFIVDYNKKNGRGGQTAASKKFKITPITISNWLKKAGVKKAGGKKGAKKKSAPKKGASGKKGRGRSTSTTATTTRKASSSKADALGRMMEIQTEIDSLQSEYDALKKQL